MPSKNICRIAIFVFLASIVFLLTSACSKRAKSRPFVPTVTVTPVQTVDLAHITHVVGQVVPIEQVKLVARVQGYLTARNFEAGSFVKKGQLLFQIQKDQYKADRELDVAKAIQAQAQYDYANIEYNRSSLLFKQNATSQTKLDEATMNKYLYDGVLKEAKADLTLADLNLSYTDIVAPFDGRVGMYTHSVGDLVDINSGTLAEVIMVDPIWVEFPYSESLFLAILQEKGSKPLPNVLDPNVNTPGIFVKLTLSDGSQYPIEGTLDYINNKVNPATGTIQMRARFANPKQWLTSGAYVQVQIGKKTKVPEFIIPQSALQEDQAGTFVFVVNDKDMIDKRYITTGVMTASDITVTKGLSAEELVVTRGILLVKPGATVKYVRQEQAYLDQPLPITDSTADTNKPQKI